MVSRFELNFILLKMPILSSIPFSHSPLPAHPNPKRKSQWRRLRSTSMASISISISISFSSPSLLLRRNRFTPSILVSHRSERAVARSLRARDPNLLRRPLVSSPSSEDREPSVASDDVAVEGRGRRRTGSGDSMDWEDMILQETVPLVGFVRMILHSGEYESGDKLSREHEKTIIERLLSYHPEYEKKIGCGIDFITIGFHPEFENSRCLFIVKKDGELVDFSYWKCIKGFIRKNYPLYADNFILRHFRRKRDY